MKSWCQWSQHFATDSTAARFIQSNETPVEIDKSGKDVCNMNYSQTCTKGFWGKVEEGFQKRTKKTVVVDPCFLPALFRN